MSQEIAITELTPERRELLQEFCDKRNQAYLGRKKIQRPRLMTLEQLLELFQQRQVYCCLGMLDAAGALVGGVLLTRRRFRGKNVGYVSSFWTEPQLQGQGLGTKLMTALCQFAERIADEQSLSGMTSEIHVWNRGSIRVNEKAGFRISHYFNNAPGNAYTCCLFRPLQPETAMARMRRRLQAVCSYTKCLAVRAMRWLRHPFARKNT